MVLIFVVFLRDCYKQTKKKWALTAQPFYFIQNISVLWAVFVLLINNYAWMNKRNKIKIKYLRRRILISNLKSPSIAMTLSVAWILNLCAEKYWGLFLKSPPPPRNVLKRPHIIFFQSLKNRNLFILQSLKTSFQNSD